MEAGKAGQCSGAESRLNREGAGAEVEKLGVAVSRTTGPKVRMVATGKLQSQERKLWDAACSNDLNNFKCCRGQRVGGRIRRETEVGASCSV